MHIACIRMAAKIEIFRQLRYTETMAGQFFKRKKTSYKKPGKY